MFSQKRISLFIIVFIFMVMIGVGLKAHFFHNVEKPGLEFTSEPDITCNIDGWTFTHTRIKNWDGTVLQDDWHKEPTDPKFKIEAKAHGIGWAHITFHGTYDKSTGGKKYGDPVNSTNEQISIWSSVLPVAVGAVEETIEVSYPGTFSRRPKTYSWDGHGTIKLVPWVWKWSLAGIIPSGTWEPAPDDFHTTKTDMAAGSWTVNRNWKTLPPPKKVQVDDDDDDGDVIIHETPSQNIVLTPSDGSSMVTAGRSYTVDLSVPSGYTSIYWYMKSPSQSGLGTSVSSVSDSTGNATSASYTYSIPSDASGDYVLTAYITLSDSTIAESSYTVSVSSDGSSGSDSPGYNEDCPLCVLYSTQSCSQCE